MAENKTRHLPPNAALAQAKYVRMTPMKCRRVIDLVRGLPVQDALDILKFDVHAASEPIYKVVSSAIANAENNKDLDRRDLAELVADHRLGHEDRDVLAAVVHGQRVAEHVGDDRGAA